MALQRKIISVHGSIRKRKIFLPKMFAFILSQIVLGMGAISCSQPTDIIYEYIEEPYTRWFLQEENNYSPAEWQECLDVLAQLNDIGITMPERFISLADAKYIVQQKLNLTDKNIAPNKPVTVVMFPRIDKTNAFSAKYNTLTDIIARPNQQLLYFEITGDADFKTAMRSLINNLPAGKELVLILAGHGNKDLLQWDHGTVAYYLDPSDYNDPEFTGLLHSLNINLVIFNSCQAGFDGIEGQNQANRMAEHIRIGGKVIAPTIDVYKENYIFRSDDSIETITYDRGEPEIIYQAEGSWVP